MRKKRIHNPQARVGLRCLGVNPTFLPLLVNHPREDEVGQGNGRYAGQEGILGVPTCATEDYVGSDLGSIVEDYAVVFERADITAINVHILGNCVPKFLVQG